MTGNYDYRPQEDKMAFLHDSFHRNRWEKPYAEGPGCEPSTTKLGACGLVDRALDSKSEGLGFEHWSCVEVLGNN